jgi:hypothetical protein
MLMKDAAVWIVLISLALLVAIANRSSGRRLIWCGLGVTALLATMAFLREHTLVVAAWAVIIAVLFGDKEWRRARIAGGVLIGVLVPWFVASIGPAGLGLITDAGSLTERRFQNAFGANTAVVDTSRVEEESRLRQELADLQGSPAPKDPEVQRRVEERVEEIEERLDRFAPPPQVADEGLLDPNVRHLPRGLSVMLLEPAPVPFTGTLSLRLARLESLIWYPLLALALVGLWNVRRHLRVFAFPLLAGGGIFVMYALTEGNVGTAHRHRGEFVWVVVLLAVYGLNSWRTRTTVARAHP